MPAEASEATRVQPTTAGEIPRPAAGRAAALHEDDDWAQIVRALTGTDEDDVPLFGRLPA